MKFFDKLKNYLNEEPDEEFDEDFEKSEKAKQADKKERKEKRKSRKKASGDNEDIKNLQKELKAIKAAKKSDNEKAVVKDVCEQLVDVSYHMEDMKQEYKVVTDYLVDIQKI